MGLLCFVSRFVGLFFAGEEKVSLCIPFVNVVFKSVGFFLLFIFTFRTGLSQHVVVVSYTIFLFYSLYYNHATNYPTIKLKTTMECKDHVKYPLFGI